MSLALSVLAFAFPAQAQVELGVDAALQFSSSDGGYDQTGFSIPTGVFRLGIGVSSRLQFQIEAVAQHVSVDNASGTHFYLSPGVVVSLREDYQTEGGPFLLAAFGVERSTGEDFGIESSDTRFGAGGGIGWRLPLTEVSAVRLLTEYTYWGESDLSSSVNLFSLVAGISLFL